MREYIVKVLSRDNERKILQHVYVMISVVMLMIAGIIGLLNHELGLNLLLVAAALIGMFVVNAVLWAIVRTAADNYLSDELGKTRKRR